MKKITVIGIGNVLMMDDGIGIALIEQLSKQNRTPYISFGIGESDIDYCVDQIMKAEFVIIVDAVSSGNNPGELAVYSLADLHDYQTLDISAHNFHLFQSLYLQKEPVKGYLIGVEPYEISFQIGLSETLREKWKKILQDVSQTIDRLIAKN